MQVASGSCIDCGWCVHTFPDADYCNHDTVVVVKKSNAAATEYARPSKEPKAICGGESAAGSDGKYLTNHGTHHTEASSVLMHMRYATRVARPDWLRPTTLSRTI